MRVKSGDKYHTENDEPNLVGTDGAAGTEYGSQRAGSKGAVNSCTAKLGLAVAVLVLAPTALSSSNCIGLGSMTRHHLFEAPARQGSPNLCLFAVTCQPCSDKPWT